MISNLDELKFEGGYPTAETIQKLYDQLDLQRAAQAYLDFMPAMSMQALLDVHPRDYGVSETGGMIVYVEPGEGKSIAIGLTYNTESIYASLSLDLKQTGPAVIEVPPKVLGIINDGFMRYVADLGNAGLDRGQGGKYLLLPPGYEGDVPEGYFVFRSSTYRNWVMVRGFEQNTGRGEAALAYYKEHFKVYPLGEGVHQPGVVSASFKPSDTTHPRDIRYFERLDQMVQYEPLSAFTPEELGLLHALGIVKGAPFQPDERMRRILSDGVRLGDGMAKAICSPAATRRPGSTRTVTGSGSSSAGTSSSATAPGSWTPAPSSTTAPSWSLRRWRPRWSASARSTSRPTKTRAAPTWTAGRTIACGCRPEFPRRTSGR